MKNLVIAFGMLKYVCCGTNKRSKEQNLLELLRRSWRLRRAAVAVEPKHGAIGCGGHLRKNEQFPSFIERDYLAVMYLNLRREI
jgi:hypothetical protein